MGTPLTSLPASVYTGSSNENGSVRSASGRCLHPYQDHKLNDLQAHYATPNHSLRPTCTRCSSKSKKQW